MKQQFYFENEDAETCYTEEYWKNYMKSEGLTKMEVMKGVPEKIKGIFWCKHEAFCGDDSSEYCGKQCNDYAPRNGKSGCCKHYTTQLYSHGEKVVLTIR